MLVSAVSFRDPWEAHLFRLRLEAEGISASIAHEHHIWLMWPYSTALGGVKVLVLPDALDDARTIYTRCQSGAYRSELKEALGEEFEESSCIHCHSDQVVSFVSNRQRAALIVSYLTFGIIFPLRKSLRHCSACGNRWIERRRSAVFSFSIAMALIVAGIGALEH